MVGVRRKNTRKPPQDLILTDQKFVDRAASKIAPIYD